MIDDLQLQIEETDAEVTSDERLVVEGDASQLRRVCQNLIDNALTYHADGPPRVHVDADRRDREYRRSGYAKGPSRPTDASACFEDNS
ncbi:hypothetical protein [Natrinema soli]|uniref:Uncharacterized protein n=1 Tax=Natrinema soli TaxID=1930624 RepID=A0ABD5SQP4_9EURY